MCKKRIEVVAGLLKEEREILLCQRRDDDTFAGLWEFPGGKIKKGETHQEALRRELKEELNIDVEVKELIGIFEDESLGQAIKIYLYRFEIYRGEIKCLGCKDYIFTSLEIASRLNLAPADKKIFKFIKSEVL